MSRMLRQLLGAREPSFTLMITGFENAAGQPAIDVRLTGELLGRHRRKLDSLGLDAQDTNGPELYHSLLTNVGAHEDVLKKTLAGGGREDVLAAIEAALRQLPIQRRCWVLKRSSLRRLLASVPPRRVMKVLGYRSIDSMLKRERPDKLLAIAYILENPAWRMRFSAKYKILKPSDFENREIGISLLDERTCGAELQVYVEERRSNIMCVREAGIVAVLPLPLRPARGLTLTLLPLILRALNDIRDFSSYAKLQQVRPDFGMRIVDYLSNGGAVYSVAGQPLTWSMMRRYLSSAGAAHAISIVEPHLTEEDLQHHSYSGAVASLSPLLELWRDSQYQGAVFEDGVVSYNLLDVSLNYCNNVPYHKRIVYHMRESLWQELLLRYLRQPHVEQGIRKQIETSLAA